MDLNEAQRQQVSGWLDAGLKLAEVQIRLEQEFGLQLTYLEVKLLVSELNLMPRDPEKPSSPPPGTLGGDGLPAAMSSATAPGMPVSPGGAGTVAPTGAGLPGGTGRVSVAVDQLARAGSLVSGQVTFSDGQNGAWYVDQTGRLGLAPVQKGYRPSPADMQQFQMTLEQEFTRLGL